ncbi:MAG: accessory gene regulator B family protein [Lachnospiraceae bacterium]|nr:accessory gene regulator B family protein [Lachnospiraceae bacterium]
MMEKCANIIADWLISCKVVEETDKELYSYAVHSIILSLSPLALAIGFGVCMGCVRQSVMIIMPFVIIRKFSGGYHTKHAWSCLIWSCLLLLLCITMSFYIKCGWEIALITVGAAVSLILNSPIDNVNRELDREEHHRYKKVTTVLVLIFVFTALLLFECRLYIYSICISIGIVLSAGLQLPCIFKEVRRLFVK